jgi:hypothetical protein
MKFSPKTGLLEPGHRRGRAALAASGVLEPHKECYQSVVNGDRGTCTLYNKELVREIKMCVYCGLGNFCPYELC